MKSLSHSEKKILGDFKKALLEKFGDRVVDVRLFGSRARGAGDDESDLDVLVLIENPTRAEKNHILDTACDMWLASDIMLSPLVMSREHFQMLIDRERLLAREIQKEGISL